LKPLRQISFLLREIAVDSRERLVHELSIPAITALDSPKQEWIRFHLNIAEALADIDYHKGVKNVVELYTQVCEDPLDLDIKAGSMGIQGVHPYVRMT
jgi:hypothetical protein